MDDMTNPLKTATFEELLIELGERCRTLIVAYTKEDLKNGDWVTDSFKRGPAIECKGIVDEYLSPRLGDMIQEQMFPHEQEKDE